MSNHKREGEQERGSVTHPKAENPSQKAGPDNPSDVEVIVLKVVPQVVPKHSIFKLAKYIKTYIIWSWL